MTDYRCQFRMTLAIVLDRLAYLKVEERNARMPAVDLHWMNLRFKQRSLLLTKYARIRPAAVLIL